MNISAAFVNRRIKKKKQKSKKPDAVIKLTDNLVVAKQVNRSMLRETDLGSPVLPHVYLTDTCYTFISIN